MSNPQILSVIPKEASFPVHSEIDLDPDAFPQSRGAEAELHASVPSVSPRQKRSPLLRLSEATATAQAGPGDGAPASKRVRYIPRLSNQERARG